MKIYKHNGERWYIDDRPVWLRAIEWVVWVGGWSVWRRGYSGFGRVWKTLKQPTPVSILGHRATFFGDWLQVRTPEGLLVVRLRESGNERRNAFISRDGTPGSAHVWLYGEPREVSEEAELGRRQRAEVQ